MFSYPLTLNTFHNYLKMFPRYGGTLAADQLPKRRQNSTFYVVNTDVRSGLGKHWVVMWIPSHGPPEYFDSLGNKPSNSFHHFLGSKYYRNTDRLQNYGSMSCGAFCLYYISHRLRGQTLAQIVKQFDPNNLTANEFIVKNFLTGL